MPKLAPDVSEKIQSLPKWARAAGLSHCFVHAGVSMLPVLRPGHLVYVRSAKDDFIPGDVIVFIRLPDSCCFTHRVIAVKETGLITQGDHNLKPDALPVPWEQVIGKVEIKEVGGRRQAVLGGAKGLRMAKFRWMMLKLEYWVRRLFGRFFRLLRLKRIVSIFWRPKIDEIHFKNERGSLVKYIYKQQTVAIWDPSLQRFDCRKPFNLVIPSPLYEVDSSS